MEISIFTKEKCLEIAKANNPTVDDEETLLCSIPDYLFGTIVSYESCDDEFYFGVDDKLFVVPKEFARPVGGQVSATSPSDAVYSIGRSLLSHTIQIGSNPWVLRIDTESAMVEVNPNVIDRQADELAKEVLKALDNAVLEEYRKETHYWCETN